MFSFVNNVPSRRFTGNKGLISNESALNRQLRFFRPLRCFLAQQLFCSLSEKEKMDSVQLDVNSLDIRVMRLVSGKEWFCMKLY